MRTVLSLVVLAAFLWASCTVKLGAFTLAEHVDRIGETDEAKALLEGTRGKIAPVLEDVKQRIFGEYVEAPTAPPRSPPRTKGERVVKTERGGSTAAQTRLPRAAVGPSKPEAEPASARADGRRPSTEAQGRKAERSIAEAEAKPASRVEARGPSTAGGSVRTEGRGPSTAEAARLPGRRPSSP